MRPTPSPLLDLPPHAETLITVGNFDGVHRGHQALLDQMVEQGKTAGLVPVALTFDPHPAGVLGGAPPAVLTPLDRKVQLLQRCAPGLQVVVEPFTRDLSTFSPERFARELLRARLRARAVVVGCDFRFGAGRSGDFETLRHLGDSLGFAAQPLELRQVGGGVVSSTRVRHLLQAGAVSEAQTLLGRPHAVTGTVVHGDALARKLGAPTANIGDPQELLPGPGVYAVLVDLAAESTFQRLATGVANIGTRPTAGGGPVRAEVHLHGFQGDLYGATLRIHLIARLREERRFPDLDALKAQLHVDVQRSEALLASHVPDPTAQGAWH